MTDEKADPPMWAGGRPAVMKDGSMLVSDDYNGIIYRVSYENRLKSQEKRGGTHVAFFFSALQPLRQTSPRGERLRSVPPATVERGNRPIPRAVARRQPAQFIATSLFMFREGNRKDDR